MNLLFLSKRDLLEIEDSLSLIDAVKDAFSSFSSGKVKQPERHVDIVNGNWWGTMIGFNDEVFGTKIVNVINTNKEKQGKSSVNGIGILFSSTTGEPECVVEGSALTGLRTAAASVLSTWIAMGSKTIGTLGVIGAGEEAFYHVKLAREFFSIDKIMITARSSHLKLAKEMGITPSDVRTLLSSSDVIFTTTSSRDPVVFGKFLREDFHISSIGAHTPDSRELDDDVITRARTIMVDSMDAVYRESGDVIIPYQTGLLKDKKVVEVGKVIRENLKIERPSVFKTVGIASQDVITMKYLCEKARKDGKGIELTL